MQTPKNPSPAAPPARILRMPEVLSKVGISRSTLYAMVAAGEFPRAVRLTHKTVGWRSTDLDRWIESREAA